MTDPVNIAERIGGSACATPLSELLQHIPADARLEIEHSPTSYSMHPVGRMCHEAADLIEQQAARLEALSAERERMRVSVVKECARIAFDYQKNIKEPHDWFIATDIAALIRALSPQKEHE